MPGFLIHYKTMVRKSTAYLQLLQVMLNTTLRRGLKTLGMTQRQKVDSSLGIVRLFSKDPETIGPGQTKVVEGSVNCRTPSAGKWVVVEPPKISSLPGGLMVINGLASFPPQLPGYIPVILKNESDHDITISPKR